MRLSALGTVALVPLLITPGLLFYFDITPKIAGVLLGVSLALLCWRENSHNLFTFVRTRTGRWFTILLVVQLLLLALATALSTNPALSLFGSTWRRSGLIAQAAVLVFGLLAAAWLRSYPAEVRNILRIVCFSGALVALYVIAQYVGFDPLLNSAAYHAGEGPFTIVRPPGTLGHADYLAAWLLFVAFCGSALAAMDSSPHIRLSAWLVSALASLAILLSGTRSALLGLAAGAIALICFRRAQPGRRAIAAVLLFACVLAVLWVSPAGAKLRARVHWSMEDRRGGARLYLWRDTVRMASSRALTGFGPEAFETGFPRFESRDLARAYPDFYHESPHNLVLDTLVAAGAPAVLMLGAVIALSFIAAHMAFRRTQPVAAPLASGLIAVLVCHQFTVFIVPTLLYLYLLISMLVAIAEPPKSPTEPAPPKGWQRIFAAASFTVACLFLWCAARLLIYDPALAVAQPPL